MRDEFEVDEFMDIMDEDTEDEGMGTDDEEEEETDGDEESDDEEEL